METFHPTIHKGLPHQGNQEVAINLLKLLDRSKLARHGLESTKKDNPDTLKQDRYPLRTSPQWLGPTTEILLASIRRVTIELNSSNDNPIIDHRRDEILHGGNFQGISTTIAMDQTRQALQLCGKLIFAQLSEILNYTMNDGLPPNLSGCDVNSDFGFKGIDTATASYASELDYLTNPLTNHILSAEMHNQSVNSMALVSARMSGSALEILQMMLTNALCAQCQAIDLRWLEGQVIGSLERLLIRCKLTEKIVNAEISLPWYQLAFNLKGCSNKLENFLISRGVHVNGVLAEFASEIDTLNDRMRAGQHVKDVATSIGKGRKFFVYDTATASYALELDYLTNPLTNHVVSAEMHNQAVNSMALVIARMTGSALELLQMILTYALCAQCQAIDLRWREGQVVGSLERLLIRCQLTEKMPDL